MQKFLLASNNEHKIIEFREILSPLGIEIISPKDLNLHLDVDEVGTTFRENSYLKAKAFFEASHLPTIADDSGLCVKALNDKPGIYSARFAKECGSYPLAFKKLNEELKGKSKEAYFHCCICFYFGKEALYFEGNCPGYLLDKPVGENGFGYDPLFHSFEADIDFGLAKEEIKNKYSHRRKALDKFVSYLKDSKDQTK